jgi:hypothetical protein
MDSGLIFVSTSDNIGKIVQAIIKQEYNYIGFFVTTFEKGYNTIKIWLVDVFTSKQPEWFKENTLDDLISNPIVYKIATKKLKPVNINGITDLEATYERHTVFKLSICDALANHQSIDLTTAIYKLFGHKCENVCVTADCEKKENWCVQSTNDLINLVMKNTGLYEELKTGKIELNDEVYKNIKYNPYALLAYNFNQLPNNNHTISSYLNENKYFESLEYIRIGDRLQVMENVEKFNVTQFFTLVSSIMLFFDLIRKNSEFHETVLQGFKLNKNHAKNEKYKTTIIELRNILKNLLNNQTSSRRNSINKNVGTLLEAVDIEFE